MKPKTYNWLTDGFEKFKDDPEYILEGRILDITEQISIRLKELEWSQKDFAKAMNTSPAWVTKLLNGIYLWI